MKLEVKRTIFTDLSTIGELSIDGEFFCYTLEDVVRDKKIYGKTAIPAGTYKVVFTYSPHFNRILPLLVGVPDYEGVRIHPGNTDADTEGCILVGQAYRKDFLLASRAAFDPLFEKIKNEKDLEITIG